MEQLRTGRASVERTLLSSPYDPRTAAPGATTRNAHEKSGAHVPTRAGLDAHTDRIISRTRLVLRVLSLILSGAIVAVLAHAVAVYYRSQDAMALDEDIGVTLRVWSFDINLRPTLVLLGCAAGATLLNLVLVIASFSKVVRHVTNIGNVATLVVSFLALALWAVVGVMYKIDDLNDTKHYDLLSYVCTRHHDATLDSLVGNFGSLCSQMRYAWWAVIAVGALELAAIATVVWGMVAMRKRGSYTKI